MKRNEENTEFIRSIRNGDPKSLELLFQMAYAPMRAYANKFVNDIDEAEEIVQDIFYKLWKNRKHLDETLSVKAYLFTAVKNSCFKYLDHKKVKDKYAGLLATLYQGALQQDSSHDAFVATELEKDLSKALDQLPAECRRIFELSRFEGLHYHEIAQRLNISPKTVETQISRALRKLRLQLKDYILIAIALFS